MLLPEFLRWKAFDEEEGCVIEYNGFPGSFDHEALFGLRHRDAVEQNRDDDDGVEDRIDEEEEAKTPKRVQRREDSKSLR